MSTEYLEYFPKPLLDDLVAGRWLPMVGAGFSRNAVIPSGMQMPLWNELGSRLAEDLRDYAYSTPLDAISAFEHEYGRPKLIERLADLLLVDEARPGDAHKAFCSIPFDLVCTTNLEFLLERQYDLIAKHCTPVVDEDQLSVNLRESGVALIKLHGDLHHPTRLVITENDYDCFLERYPLLATFLANLLITRTAVLIGYSLEDPDFRQIWQVVGERLGRSRRVAYTIVVDAKAADLARFERRGVKAINLPGNKNRYPEVLTNTFRELREYWQEHFIPASQVREEEPLQELSLPRDAQTRLCFFAIPLTVQPFYRERIFPVVREFGFVPVTADDVVSPGENFLAKIDALLGRALLVVVDASTQFTLAELRMALARIDASRILVVTTGVGVLPVEVANVRVLVRPNITAVEPEEFFQHLREWFDTAARRYATSLVEEPMRLLRAREYRAAVISAITLLETNLRRRLDLPSVSSKRLLPLRQVLEQARGEGLLGDVSVQTIMEWLRVRNEVVHTQREVQRAAAERIVAGVLEIVRGLGGLFGA